MTIENILELLKHPTRISSEQYGEIQELVQLYPYCASLKFLYLQALSIKEDARYISELQRLTLHIPDRSLLYRMVEGNMARSSMPEPDANDGFAIIDAFLDKEQSLGTDLPTDLNYTGTCRDDYFATENEEQPQGWIAEDPTPSSTKEVIESLLPSIPTQTVSEASELEEELFTETLAKIYIKQGHYDKAIRIVRGLNLQYPDKNSYFAEQLRFLELLSNNDKAI